MHLQVNHIAWNGKTPIDLPVDFRLEARVRLPEDGAAALNIACGDETIVLTLDRAASRATLSVLILSNAAASTFLCRAVRS